ncbi:unnamed protein product [Prunus brigantina]
MMFHNDETDETSEESVVGFTPPPAPASEPSPPQLNQPPLSQTKSFEKFSIKLRKRMARLANEVVKLTGCVHLGIPLKEPFTGDFIIKMPMLTAPSTIVSSPLLPAAGDLQSTEVSLVGVFGYVKQEVLYNCFLDCLVALPIAARQQIAVVILLLCRCFLKCLIASLTTVINLLLGVLNFCA